ncbi:MAG: hypothetical protein R6X35_16550, partial [Candidatus Krumholzibacteriia bacterium]
KPESIVIGEQDEYTNIVDHGVCCPGGGCICFPSASIVDGAQRLGLLSQFKQSQRGIGQCIYGRAIHLGSRSRASSGIPTTREDSSNGIR